ncbi:MAG: UDP-N-acetylmuramoyl-L-alanyl-D-glutamate--2,6-diaminopimelate ligase [Phycisphaeraceae bacterium]
MQLDALIAGLPLRLVRGAGTLELSDLVDDSREAERGCAFIARGGAGQRHIQDAISRGAAAVLADRPPSDDVPASVAWVQADEPLGQPLAGRLAERYFHEPSRRLALVGVTGTNGKTTTAWLMRHLLAAAGHRCGLIGTVAVHETGDTGPPGPPPINTTPGAVMMSRLLARMAERGCEAAAVEVSSHALEQGRCDALRFAGAVFTNLTGDHLDYHGTMTAYAEAKARLFALLGKDAAAVVNGEDAHAPAMRAAFVGGDEHVWSCAVAGGEAPATQATAGRDARVTRPTDVAASLAGQRCVAEIVALTATHSDVRFAGPWGAFDVRLPLVGRHNVANALQAAATAHAVLKLDAAALQRGLASAPPVPGRLEAVAYLGPGREPSVLVDYAHTDDALDNVLAALRPLVDGGARCGGGRLIVVFGCGGDRDRTKRPRMARVAARWADRIIITSDNPRTEQPGQIVDEIVAGLGPDAPAHEAIVDRAAAIAHAIAEAAPRDTVLIAGKGHEDYQIVGHARQHFDDREHALAALQQRAATNPAEGVA